MNKVAEFGKWIICQRADGVYEAWKSKGIQHVYTNDQGDMRKLAKDIERRVLSATTLDEAMNEVKRFRRPRIVISKYDPRADKNQLRIE